jgi:hypothetical protein
MPHYFFNTANGSFEPDPDGIDLSDDAAARVHAIKFAGDVMHHEPDVLWDGSEFRVQVTDDEQQLLFTIEMKAIDAQPEKTG